MNYKQVWSDLSDDTQSQGRTCGAASESYQVTTGRLQGRIELWRLLITSPALKSTRITTVARRTL